MNALKKRQLRRMTIPEFLTWADERPEFWQLRDGEPEMMSPPTTRHGSIQAELGALVRNHLVATGRNCHVIVTPGVIPRLRSDRNMLVPDLAVECGAPSDARAMREPVLLIEIISPSNETQTRANVWAFTTIPSVAEIVLLNSTAIGAEILRRDGNGHWPELPELVGPDGTLRLASIGFEAPLRDAYRTTGLAATG